MIDEVDGPDFNSPQMRKQACLPFPPDEWEPYIGFGQWRKLRDAWTPWANSPAFGDFLTDVYGLLADLELPVRQRFIADLIATLNRYPHDLPVLGALSFATGATLQHFSEDERHARSQRRLRKERGA